MQDLTEERTSISERTVNNNRSRFNRIGNGTGNSEGTVDWVGSRYGDGSGDSNGNRYGMGERLGNGYGTRNSNLGVMIYGEGLRNCYGMSNRSRDEIGYLKMEYC